MLRNFEKITECMLILRTLYILLEIQVGELSYNVLLNVIHISKDGYVRMRIFSLDPALISMLIKQLHLQI